MPTYEYCCNACGHAFEFFQQMSAPVKKKCPECGTLKLKRLIGSGSAVMFKGSGFYLTDYKNKPENKKSQVKKEKKETKPKKIKETSDKKD